MPTLTVVTEVFEPMSRIEAAGLCMPDIPLYVVPHPIVGRDRDHLRQWAEELIPTLEAAWGLQGRATSK